MSHPYAIPDPPRLIPGKAIIAVAADKQAALLGEAEHAMTLPVVNGKTLLSIPEAKAMAAHAALRKIPWGDFAGAEFALSLQFNVRDIREYTADYNIISHIIYVKVHVFNVSPHLAAKDFDHLKGVP